MLTNREAITEKLKEVYGDFFEQVKFMVDTFGWINSNILSPLTIGLPFEVRDLEFRDRHHKTREYWRPRALEGMETNNGWNRLTNDPDSFPEQFKRVKVRAWGGKSIGGQEVVAVYDPRGEGTWMHPEFINREIRAVTHWKPLIEDKAPQW